MTHLASQARIEDGDPRRLPGCHRLPCQDLQEASPDGQSCHAMYHSGGDEKQYSDCSGWVDLDFSLQNSSVADSENFFLEANQNAST